MSDLEEYFADWFWEGREVQSCRVGGISCAASAAEERFLI
jgi:hypothetical protein